MLLRALSTFRKLACMSISEEADTLVIGAGAAGLAAASELASNGQHVAVLEARDRAGGRILTDCNTVAGAPIELGAEFIHGESPALMRWLRAANDVAVDASRQRWIVHGTALRSADSRLREVKTILGGLPPPRRDIPFAEFLQRHRRVVSQKDREFARMMIEGFDAADIERISTHEILHEWSGPAAVDAPTFRPARGYGNLMQFLRQTLPPERVTLHFATKVRGVTWREGGVTVDAHRHGEPVRFRAARAIVALPLSILQLPSASPHSVRFTPELPGKRTALSQLAVGPVVRVVLHFVRPFWAELDDGRYRKAAFFFAPKAAFPTFWTSLPVRTSLLVAWCAGSRANNLAGKNEGDIIGAARASLREVFGRRNYSALLQGVFWHDWQGDPFSCGAYSYVTARGAAARRSLARPVQDTLFFAGEACDTRGEAATVGGALRSGSQAARQVLGRAKPRRRAISAPSRGAG